MKPLPVTLSFLALLLAGSLVALSCGSGSQMNQLQSIAVSPSSANAEDYPNGEVQFTATATYANPPHTGTISTNWVACGSNLLDTTTEITVTPNGVGQCEQGATGTYEIVSWAVKPVPGNGNCPAINACGVSSCTVVGTAQLTCP